MAKNTIIQNGYEKDVVIHWTCPHSNDKSGDIPPGESRGIEDLIENGHFWTFKAKKEDEEIYLKLRDIKLHHWIKIEYDSNHTWKITAGPKCGCENTGTNGPGQTNVNVEIGPK